MYELPAANMPRITLPGLHKRMASLFGLMVVLCSIVGAQTGRPDFERFVIVGDSLAAGFQNFSLFDDATGAPAPGGQKQGFASLFAKQAGVTLTMPLVTYPGIPSALTLASTSPLQIVPAPGSGIPEALLPGPSPAPTINDISIPGILVSQALGYVVPSGNPGNDGLPIVVMAPTLLLPTPRLPTPLPCGVTPLPGGKVLLSQLACALQWNPTTALVEIGNNDALQALISNVQPTSPTDFRWSFGILMGSLKVTGATLIVSNIPDVTTLPFLVSYQQFKSACPGVSWPAKATLNDFVVPNPLNPSTFCMDPQVRAAPLIASTKQAVAAYNQIIAETATLFGATLVDFNGLFADISKSGYKLGTGQVLTTSFLGGLFSLDGIHPTNTGYGILANRLINTVNSKLHTNMAPVSVDDIADKDPLVPHLQ